MALMNSKECCKTLKTVRKKIADANGIPYEPLECTHKGDCKGTCPACEAEVRYIEKELNVRRLAGQSIKIVGLASSLIAMASCSSSGSSEGVEAVSSQPRLEQTLMGDTICADFRDTVENDNMDGIVDDDSMPPPPPPPPSIPFVIPNLEGFVSHKYLDSMKKKELQENTSDSVAIKTNVDSSFQTDNK